MHPGKAKIVEAESGGIECRLLKVIVRPGMSDVSDAHYPKDDAEKDQKSDVYRAKPVGGRIWPAMHSDLVNDAFEATIDI